MTQNSASVDLLVNACKDVVQRELNRIQFAAAYSIENQDLLRKFIQQRTLKNKQILPDDKHERIFQITDKSFSDLHLDNTQLKYRQLPFWRDLDLRKIDILNNTLGPRNIWEEQIEWTKKGKMWPYPINNEYLLGEEERTSFVDHVFLESELAKYKLPPSKSITHFMELIIVGLSKNPHMSVNKKREHVRWFADYFNKAHTSKYREILSK